MAELAGRLLHDRKMAVATAGLCILHKQDRQGERDGGPGGLVVPAVSLNYQN